MAGRSYPVSLFIVGFSVLISMASRILLFQNWSLNNMIPNRNMGMPTLSAAMMLVLLSIGTSTVRGVHFRGGTVRWAPIPGVPNISESDGRPSKIRVQFDVSFKHSVTVPDHQSCSEDELAKRSNLRSRGSIECANCYYYSDPPIINPIAYMKWVCNDLNPIGDYAAGSYVLDLDIYNNTYPDVNKFVIFYEEECWVKPLTPGNEICQKWKVMTEVDLTRRSDIDSINSSPITSTIPIQQAYAGCDYTLLIPVSDPNGDTTRCRMTSDREGDFECPVPGKFAKDDVCGDLERVTIYENCTLKFNTHGASGNYAIRLMIEDFDDQNIVLSKVSLSFLLYVNPGTTNCDAPKVWSPNACQLIHVGTEFRIDIIAEAANSKSIQRIDTVKPYGMTSSVLKPDVPDPDQPLQKYVTLTWTPQASGRYTVTFQATDSQGLQSVSGSIILHVVETDAELQLYPIEDGSWPKPGLQGEDWSVSSDTRWKINFNKNIKRPTQPAYIKLVESSTGVVVYSVDVSSDENVEFKKRAIRFTPVISKGNAFHVELDDGVAVLAYDNCIKSTYAKWLYEAARRPDPITTPLPISPPIYECTADTVDIIVPDDRENCFVHLEQVTKVNDNFSLSYMLCCPGDCPDEEDEDQQQQKGRGDIPGE